MHHVRGNSRVLQTWKHTSSVTVAKQERTILAPIAKSTCKDRWKNILVKTFAGCSFSATFVGRVLGWRRLTKSTCSLVAAISQSNLMSWHVFWIIHIYLGHISKVDSMHYLCHCIWVFGQNIYIFEMPILPLLFTPILTYFSMVWLAKLATTCLASTYIPFWNMPNRSRMVQRPLVLKNEPQSDFSQVLPKFK